MTPLVWCTREPLREAFADAWNARLAALPLANFSMRLDCARWEADQGRHALLVLAAEDRRRAALVVREVERELHSGWPWRWQAALENPDPGLGPGIARDDAEWLFEQAERVAGGRRLRCFLPAAPPPGVGAYVAGATIVQSIAHDDEALLSGMSDGKRRLFRRAAREGFRVREGRDAADYARFRELQRISERLRQEAAPEDPAPPAGHGFREWDLPWMSLLIALQGDALVAGVGDGIVPRGVVEGRAAAVAPEVRRLGVMALLCHHEARWLRDRGHRWLNHGGDTYFKREVAGTLGRRVLVHAWLGGGPRWAGVNAAEAWARRARPQVAGLVRAMWSRRAKSRTVAV